MSELHRRYAAALCALMPDEAALRAASGVLLGSAPLAEALQSPCVTPGEKSALLGRILGGDTDPALLAFFRLLCRKGRFALLPGILTAFHAQVLAGEHTAEAHMRSAFPPTAQQCESIAKALALRWGRSRVDLTVEVDPALLGGFVLQLGDEVYDRSILGSLKDLGRVLEAPNFNNL